MTITEYRAYERHRQDIISANRSRRMKSLDLLATPPRVARPMRVMIETKAGEYVGTADFDVSADDAIDEAVELGAIASADDVKITMVL